MSLEKIHLRKLLQLFYLPEGKRKSILRADIRNEIAKASGIESDGGDFHAPFWTDAKKHVGGTVDLREQAHLRIIKNKARGRLYPLLAAGFLKWWDEKRRWRNEPFEIISQSVKFQLSISELNVVVKVENLLAVKVGDQFNRIVYPYFAEQPVLQEEGGRIGLWLLGQALATYPIDDLRILDVLRSASFATVDYPLRGNEEEIFLRRYAHVLAEWNELRKDY